MNAVAPIRICDNGGWTDTWFAGHGKVFNIAVSPFVEVQVMVHPIGSLSHRVVLDVENYGEHYGFEPGALPDRHPLLEAAVDEIGVPDELSVEISVFSEAPAGCSTGTSAALTVALIGALDRLTPNRLTAHQVASTAHRIEVERLAMQSGIQDQFCAAYGGINFIEISSYPRASVSQLQVSDDVWWELERRLVLVFLGRAHLSATIHERVIAALGGEASVVLADLRRAAEEARDAVSAADFAALGRAMRRNTEAQRELLPDLISPAAETVMDVADRRGALGCKVNGAGGDGGSITILCGPDTRARRALVRALGDADPSFQVIPTRLSRDGLRVWVD